MLVNLFKRHLIRISLSLVILAVFLSHVSGWINIDALDRLELFAYDQRMRITAPNGVDDRIVIIDIDEESLAAEGRWPWSRNKLAALLDQLFDEYGVSVVGFDVVFAEPDVSSGLHILKDLAATEFRNDPRFAEKVESLKASLDYDELFRDAIAKYPVVLGYTFNSGSKVGALPEPVFRKGTFKGRNVNFVVLDGYAANLAEFQEVAFSAGHFTPAVDADGVVRRIPMLYEFEEQQYESLSLAIARAVLNAEEIIPGYVEGASAGQKYTGLEWLQIGQRAIPVDRRVQTLVPYRGKKGSFPYVSATHVLNGTVEGTRLDGRIALIGTSAPGLLDLRSTPLQSVYPGVEVHANMIAGIIDGNIKLNPSYTLGAEFLLVAVSGLLIALLLPLMSPLWGTVATLALLCAVVGVNLAIWQWGNLVLPLATGIVLLFVMYLFSTTYALFVETRGKRQLAGLFGQYVPPELVDEMSEDPEAFSLEGESRELTVLFSDVRSFTTISEGLEPKELSQLMNEYLTPMTGIIHDHSGTIDKYMGDAIMAFWGAPISDPEHAKHALEAAIEMLNRLKLIHKDFEKRGWPPIKIGVGLNTGNMNVGNMGSEFRMAYTVLGDAVNLGSRLEGLTKGYGVELIVSETTAAAVPDYIYREIDKVRVKGKDKPVTIYEPVGLRKEIEKPERDEIKLYDQALKLYRQENWDMAELQFLNLQKMSPDKPLYKLYAERIARFRKEPPPSGWDGVYTHETK